MYTKRLAIMLVSLLGVVSGARAAELSVNSMGMPPDSTVTLTVSGDIADESTYGVTIMAEIVTRVGNTGTLEFTAEPPVDVVQLGDPWPGAGTFTPYDTGGTGSVLLNGSVDDNGTFVPAPVTFSGDLSGFPIIASAGADGVWDIYLSTSAGDSSWEGLTTTLVAGTVTVSASACILDTDCDDVNECTDDVCVSGFCQNNNLADGTACTDDGNECTDDYCAAGLCTHPDLVAGTPCGDPLVDDCTNADTCDGAGTCLANDVAAGTACTDDGNECTDDVCDGGGVCTHPNLIDGTACTDDGNDCTDDYCTTGVCTHPNLAAGTACGDPSVTDCTAADTCDGAGTCLANDVVSGTACTDDGNECTDDICDGGGTCIHPDFAAGTACGDPSVTDCTAADTCDGAGTCLANDVAAGTACTDDGNDCTDDVCDGAGTCTHPNFAAGTACGSPTDNDCTNPDTCDGAGTCLANDEANGTACTDDGNECTDDICDGAGACTHPNLTDGTACTDDGNDCTDDYCTTGVCAHPNLAVGAPCGNPLVDDCTGADTCDGAGVCLANHVAAGTGCTDDGNDCTDDVCDGAGACTHPNLAAGTACGDPTDNDCTDPDTCDGAGTCLANDEAAGTACTDDGNDCTDDVCDGGGACTHPDLAAGTACGNPSVTDCTAADTCDGAGTCLANDAAAGTSCVDDLNECTGDVCDGAGACTHPNLAAGTPCGDPSVEECTTADTCDGAGTCVTNDVPAGTPCTDDGNECTDDICDGIGACTHPDLADDTPCTDDGNDCTDDYCTSGVCTHPNLGAGTPCGDPSVTDCTAADTCDGAGACQTNDVAAGTACTDDGNDCTDDVCDGGGACTHPNLAAGTACGDPGVTDCTAADTCDGAGTCLDNHVAAGTACTDDGNDCTDDVCDGGGACTHPNLAAGTACGDPGITECTAADTCDGAGTCLANDAAAGTTCISDMNECTSDVCDGAGACIHPNEAAGTPCGDPSVTDCTTADTCDGAGICLANDVAAGTACTDDGNECTDDVCDGAGACAHPNLAAGTACGNPLVDDCTNADTCDGAGTCLANHLPGGTACLDDGNDCTSDVCDGVGNCTHPNLPAGAACGDATDDDCTAPDTCDGSGTCLANHATSGTACTDDGNDCTGDVCDGAGSCTHPDLAVGTPCGDPTNDDCTAPDTCDGAGTCLPNHVEQGEFCTGDGNECTDDICDGAGVCAHPPLLDGFPCSGDGNECTDDVCASGVCTHPNLEVGTPCGNAVDNDCTNPDTCDGAGTCLANHEPSGTACTDDGNECTSDTCDGSGTCTHPPLANGTACTDDGNECTNDICTAGNCSHPNWPAGTICGDPLDDDCTNPDTCNGLGTCLANHEASGTACIDDGNECTDDVCDGSGICTHPNLAGGTLCTDDGSVCTVDVCDGAGTCIHPSNNTCGACCVDGACDDYEMQVSGCLALEGEFSLGGVCLGNRACCLDTGECRTVDGSCCPGLGGTTHEAGVTCLGDGDGDGVDDLCQQLLPFAPCEAQKILAGDANTYDFFGVAVAVSGNTAVVGADGDDEAGNNAGAAYVFRRSGADWTQEAKLTVSDQAAGDHLGKAVSISGDWVVVGVPNDDDAGSSSGSAYVFGWDGLNWVEQAKLVAADGAGNDYFGTAVAIGEDVVVVGAYGDDDAQSLSGSAYIFRRNDNGTPSDPSDDSWHEEVKLTAPGPVADARFGYSVAIDGDLVVIGAPKDDSITAGSGAAYIFRWNEMAWAYEAKLFALEVEQDDSFGSSVSISGDLVLIGSHLDDEGGTNESGSAYVFRNDGSAWSEEAKLTAADAAPDDQFGNSVSISGRFVAVGASAKEGNTGSVYAFRREGTTWTDETKMTASDEDGGAEFGHAAAVSGTGVLIGVLYDDASGFDSGSAYFFQLAGVDSDQDGVLDPCDRCPDFDDNEDEDLDVPGGVLTPDGIPDGCDNCDLYNPDQIDCQPNGIGDVCDIAYGTSPDCQPNGVPDFCDIRDGTSLDADEDGMPDECFTCSPPLVEAAGPRYIAITPQPLDDSEPVSFVVTSPGWPCLNKYVGGFLECGDTGIRCLSDADCNHCDGVYGGPCLSDQDCKTCTESHSPCQTNQDCNLGQTCVQEEYCVISGDVCTPHLPLGTVDLNNDGIADGRIASLVDDPAYAALLTPRQWGTMFERCSISFAVCADDSDCDIGACSRSGNPCSRAGQDCPKYCTVSPWECDTDADCIAGFDDVCTLLQTCEPYETCDPGRLYLTGKDILPSESASVTTYEIRADCGSLTQPANVIMPQWCDTDMNWVVNMADVQAVVLGFTQEYPPAIPPRTLVGVDLVGGVPCVPDQAVSFDDVQQTVLAFKSWQYNPDVLDASDMCDVPCP